MFIFRRQADGSTNELQVDMTPGSQTVVEMTEGVGNCCVTASGKSWGRLGAEAARWPSDYHRNV